MLFAVGEESVLPTRALTPVLTNQLQIAVESFESVRASRCLNLSLQGDLGIVFRTVIRPGHRSDVPIVRIRLVRDGYSRGLGRIAVRKTIPRSPCKDRF